MTWDIEAAKKRCEEVRTNVNNIRRLTLQRQLAEADLPAAIARIEQLKAWVNDLHSGMYINCVYCGHRYGPSKDTPVAMADVLKEHIATCPDHPLSEAIARIEWQEKMLERAKAIIETCGCGMVEDDGAFIIADRTHWLDDLEGGPPE